MLTLTFADSVVPSARGVLRTDSTRMWHQEAVEDSSPIKCTLGYCVQDARSDSDSLRNTYIRFLTKRVILTTIAGY